MAAQADGSEPDKTILAHIGAYGLITFLFCKH